MPTYKYTLKNGKTMWYAAFNYTNWTEKTSIHANVDLKRSEKQKNMSGHSWIRRKTPVTYFSLHL